MTLRELPSLRSVIKQHDLRAKKGLGQNFILNPARLSQLAAFPGALHQVTVIEVGSGPGGLTRALLELGALRVIAVEQDERCIPILKSIQDVVGKERLMVHHADALQLDLGILDQELCGDSSRIIVANLPYHISVPLTLQWLQAVNAFAGFFLMFQKEVADRITAAPGSKIYGRLSVMAQWVCTVKRLLTLPPRDFSPSPSVFSAFVQFLPIKAPSPVSWETMEWVTKVAFSQRRKMLRVVLKKIWPDPVPVLERIGIEPMRRPETLSVDEFVKLAQQLSI